MNTPTIEKPLSRKQSVTAEENRINTPEPEKILSRRSSVRSVEIVNKPESGRVSVASVKKESRVNTPQAIIEPEQEPKETSRKSSAASVEKRKWNPERAITEMKKKIKYL